MIDRHQRHESESRDQALRRLALQAINLDIRVLEYVPTNEVYATSYSQPDRLHRLTAVSCDCAGFQRHGQCMHFAVFLWHRGELPPLDPDPSPPAMPVVLCGQCDQPMTYLADVSFRCSCGHAWSCAWQPADILDRILCTISQSDPDRFTAIERLLSPGGGAVPAGVDPDQCPSRGDVCHMTGLYGYSANEHAAVLLWQRARQNASDRHAA